MAPLTALHRQTVPPSGHSLAVSCALATRGATAEAHLVTARNNVLRVYRVNTHANRLEHVASRQLHGRITAVRAIRTLGREDRLVVAVHHAKMVLLEWEPHAHDLVPVSLHTYEKLPQVDDERDAQLAVDPAGRLVALLLPTNSGGDATLALLPFFTEELDYAQLGIDAESSAIPYAPSHLVPLASLTQPPTVAAGTPNALTSTGTPPIRNVVSMHFLPGFTEPTVAVLYAPDWTWAGRLEYLAQNYLVSLVTLSSKSAAEGGGTRAVVISTSPPLPYSCLSLAPCPTALGGTGGVLVTTANGLLYVDAQSGRVVAAPVNGWFARDYPPGRPKPAGLAASTPDQPTLRERLEGSQVEFYTHATATENDRDDADAASAPPPRALVWCRSGAVIDVAFTLTGRTIASMQLERVADAGALTGGGAATMLRIASRPGREGWLFVGSETGSSALLKWSLPVSGGPDATADGERKVLSMLAASGSNPTNGTKAEQDMDVDADEDGASGRDNAGTLSIADWCARVQTSTGTRLRPARRTAPWRTPRRRSTRLRSLRSRRRLPSSRVVRPRNSAKFNCRCSTRCRAMVQFET